MWQRQALGLMNEQSEQTRSGEGIVALMRSCRPPRNGKSFFAPLSCLCLSGQFIV